MAMAWPTGALGPSGLDESRPAMGAGCGGWLGAGSSRGKGLFEIAFAEIDRIDASLSSYRATSEISRINRRATVERVTTDPETFGLLRRSLAYSARSAGPLHLPLCPLLPSWRLFRDQRR